MAYPSTLDSDATLYLAANFKSTTLTASITSASTTLTVASTTGFPSVGILRIEDSGASIEFVKYTGLTATTFTGCTRGFDGDFPATSHTSGQPVTLAPAAQLHNALKDATINIETALGVDPQLKLGKWVVPAIVQNSFTTTGKAYPYMGGGVSYGGENLGSHGLVQMPIGQACTAKKLVANIYSNAGTGNVVITVMVNNSASGLVLTIPAGTTGVVSVSADVTLTATDLVHFEVVPAAGANCLIVGWTTTFQLA